jgi:archaemetzincin
MKELFLVPIELCNDDDILSWLGARLADVFGVRPRIVRANIASGDCFDRVRNQYEARWLLARLAELPTAGLVLGITPIDLFIPVFTFVIGEAYLNGRAAVISTYRLPDERYGMPPNPERFRQRLLKEAIHELGHCHGLLHCHEPGCVMQASSLAEDLDLKSVDFCDSCRRRLVSTGTRKARP